MIQKKQKQEQAQIAEPIQEQNQSGNILTYTGIFMNPLHPEPEQLAIEDIAHSLSMLARANGHFKSFHSVAQHCMECYEEARARGYSREVRLFCFLHDAAEAYLGDFVSPVKKQIDSYKETESCLLDMVYEKYVGRLPDEEEEEKIEFIDHLLLHYEFLALMGVPVNEGQVEELCSEPDFSERDWRDVEKEFIALFYKIT
ncbi:MAG: phosphohydrolase [Eubacterium sp.]|nr:phosphohydrolase [Eubacterium sp.]